MKYFPVLVNSNNYYLMFIIYHGSAGASRSGEGSGLCPPQRRGVVGAAPPTQGAHYSLHSRMEQNGGHKGAKHGGGRGAHGRGRSYISRQHSQATTATHTGKRYGCDSGEIWVRDKERETDGKYG